MASYSLIFKKSAAKDLRNIPNQDVKRILEPINLLCNNPRTGIRQTFRARAIQSKTRVLSNRFMRLRMQRLSCW